MIRSQYTYTCDACGDTHEEAAVVEFEPGDRPPWPKMPRYWGSWNLPAGKYGTPKRNEVVCGDCMDAMAAGLQGRIAN